VGQLLTHTAGFGHPGHPAHPASYPDLVRLAEDLGATGPDHTPGQRFVYSDAGSAVLGAVVAELDGRRLEDALHERVVRPLDMNDTLAGVPAGDPRIDRVPVSYRLGEDGFEPYRRPTDPPRLPYLPGSGGLCSTAADFARFLSAWADDVRDGTGRLLPRDLAVSAVTPSPGTRDTDPRGSYGQHWWIYSTPHPGAPDAQLAFGHDGSDGTWALAVPALDLIVVYLTQSRHGDTLAAMSGLVRRLIEG
jgi:CubicO group peptidase (beta-lactamase class C family)